jgi:hypothetical protein
MLQMKKLSHTIIAVIERAANKEFSSARRVKIALSFWSF